MENKTSRPNWWQLYLLLPLIAVLAWADTRLVVGDTEHKLVEIGAVLFVGWLANRWISANETRMIRQSSGSVKATLVRDELPATNHAPAIDFHGLSKSQSLYDTGDSTRKTPDHFPWFVKN